MVVLGLNQGMNAWTSMWTIAVIIGRTITGRARDLEMWSDIAMPGVFTAMIFTPDIVGEYFDETFDARTILDLATPM